MTQWHGPDPYTCRHCGQHTRLDGSTPIHTHTNTSTGTPHILCGHDGEMGTSAEPYGEVEANASR